MKEIKCNQGNSFQKNIRFMSKQDKTMRCILRNILFVLMFVMSINVMGQYNPANPAEPGAAYKAYTLTLEADPVGGGTFNLNATSSQTEGTTFWVQANVATNFTFVNWTENGEVISTVARFQYTMPSHDAKLVAHYQYTPAAPGEPVEANIPVKPVYSPLYLMATPVAGGSFNIASGNSYEVGTAVSVRANPANNFRFVNWTRDGEEISTSATFSYTMRSEEEGNSLMANFVYEPGNPIEPTQHLYHKVFLLSNPAAGGTFNVASGNEYEEGTSQTFRANNNTWYTFVNWTDENGEVLSTNSAYTFNIPNKDITIIAHYTYNYNPASPNEPASSTDAAVTVYAMTENAVAGQTVSFPVYLENTSEIGNMTAVLTFPEGFIVQTESAALAERAAGKSLTITALAGNAYRFDITGGSAITSANGKLFEVPVVIDTEAQPDSVYTILVSNAARINDDDSKVMLNTRNGFVYVEQQREDGLYASFTYDKLQNRVKFSNQSSDKTLDWTWNFGDGTSSTERDPMHIYASPGYYDVTLTVQGQTGTDMSLMTIYINDKTSWRVDGTLFLDAEQKGVRYFTTAEQLLDFISASPIATDVKVMVKESETFSCLLDDENITQLTTIKNRLAAGSYTLTWQRNGEGTTPTVGFGEADEVINADVVDLFTSLGQNMVLDDVNMDLWGIRYDPTKIDSVMTQTIISSEQTAEVDFSMISPDLTFTWTAVDNPDVTGQSVAGTGALPSMTLFSSGTDEVILIYNVVGKKEEIEFCSFTHTITIRPALVGSFTTMTPSNGVSIEQTTVKLEWNVIENAVYDVYLWNALNQRPTTPMAQGITATTFTSENFCQDRKSYKWQVVARNSTQQIESDVQTFSVRLLPNLHVTAISVDGELEAGRTATISWKVRNDGQGSTDEQAWIDRLWIVPDVYGGTGQTTCKLLKSQTNIKFLAPGEEYVATATIDLDYEQYGSFYLLASADMSSVTAIEWDIVGGSIVNPYVPVETGYLFATTLSADNKVTEHGETQTRSDNFFYLRVTVYMPQMSDEDWNNLKQAYAEMGNGETWTNKWDFDVERHTVQTLPGVAMRDGRVVSINLSDNGLTGLFPYTLLALSALETLNVSENQLTGDVGEGMQQFLAENDDFSSALRALNIANNKLEGNIGVFAQSLSNLTTLYAADNALSDVSPALATDVTTVTLDNQTIDKEVVVYVDDMNSSEVWAQIPAILLYDPATGTYAENIRLLCEEEESLFSTTLMVSEDDIQTLVALPKSLIPLSVVAKAIDDDETPTGSTVKVTFAYRFAQISLADDEDNNTVIAEAAEAAVPYNVTLVDRTIIGDGAWNSLCLPFSVTDISQTPLANMDIRELTEASVEGVSLRLVFSANVTTIEAGKPYIVRFNGENVVNPEFMNVMLSTVDNSFTSDDGDITFSGTYAPVEIADEGDNTKLYVNSANRLSWPNGQMTIGAQRAFFQLNSDLIVAETIVPGAKQIMNIFIDYGNGEVEDYVTGIESIFDTPSVNYRNTDVWYGLDGRKNIGKPLKGGIYIIGGKKLIIK